MPNARAWVTWVAAWVMAPMVVPPPYPWVVAL